MKRQGRVGETQRMRGCRTKGVLAHRQGRTSRARNNSRGLTVGIGQGATSDVARGSLVASRTKRTRFRPIDHHRDEFAVSRTCNVLDLSRSGYYAWRGRPPASET